MEAMATGELPAVITVDEFAALVRIGRGSAYEAVRRGEFPSIRVGKRILIPTAKLLQQLGAADVPA